MILALESPPLVTKIFVLVTISFVFLVLVDKRVMFHHVLFIERNLCHGKYSRQISIIHPISALLRYFKIFKIRELQTKTVTSCLCLRLDFMVRTGLLMFLLAAGLVVTFMETINSAINSKDTKKVSTYGEVSEFSNQSKKLKSRKKLYFLYTKDQRKRIHLFNFGQKFQRLFHIQ